MAEIRAEGNVVELLPVTACALCLDKRLRHEVSADNERLALVSRAAEDGGVVLVGMVDDISARDEAAHAVTEHDVRHIGVVFDHDVVQTLLVRHDAEPAVVIVEEAAVGLVRDRLPVTEVVVTDGKYAVFGEKEHKIVIAVYVLGDAVDDLHDGARRAVRDALSGVNGVHGVCGAKCEVGKLGHFEPPYSIFVN